MYPTRRISVRRASALGGLLLLGGCSQGLGRQPAAHSAATMARAPQNIPVTTEPAGDAQASTTAPAAPTSTTVPVVPVSVPRPRTTVTVPAPPPTAPPATVERSGVWSRLAQCESGSDPGINTGNGYYGAFQFRLSTWQSVGGTGYPHQHSYAEQLAAAQRLQARSGWGQWPACSRMLGLR